jgi:hypothetical protein
MNLKGKLDKLLDIHSQHVIGFGWKKTTDRFANEYEAFVNELARIEVAEKLQSQVEKNVL